MKKLLICLLFAQGIHGAMVEKTKLNITEALNITQSTVSTYSEIFKRGFNGESKDVVLWNVHCQEHPNELSIVEEMNKAGEVFAEKTLLADNCKAKNILMISDLANPLHSIRLLEKSETSESIETSYVYNLKKSPIIFVSLIGENNSSLLKPDRFNTFKEQLEKIRDNCPYLEKIIISYDRQNLPQSVELDRIASEVFHKKMLKQSRARAIEKKDISRKERKALNITKDTQRALLREIQHSFDDTNKDVVLFLIHEQEKKNQSIAIEMTGAERFYIEKVLSQIDGEAKNIVIVSDILNMNVENLVDFSSSMIFIERSENGKVVELSLLDNIKKSEIILVNVAASNDPLMSPDILEKHLEKIKENCPNFKRIIINFDEDGICQQGWMDDFDKVIAKVFSKEMGQSIIKQLEETVHCLKEECEQKKEKCEFFKKFQRELEEATNNFELKKAANSIIEEEIAKLQEEILAEQEKLTMQLALEEKNKELDQLRFHEERAIDEEKRFIFNQKLAEEEERRLQAREGAQKEFERRQTIETFFKEDLQRLNAEKKDHSEKVQNTTQESSKSKNISLLQSLYDKKYWIGGGVSLSALVVLILYYNFYH